jgi:hypothetical protein
VLNPRQVRYGAGNRSFPFLPTSPEVQPIISVEPFEVTIENKAPEISFPKLTGIINRDARAGTFENLRDEMGRLKNVSSNPKLTPPKK